MRSHYEMEKIEYGIRKQNRYLLQMIKNVVEKGC